MLSSHRTQQIQTPETAETNSYSSKKEGIFLRDIVAAFWAHFPRIYGQHVGCRFQDKMMEDL
jgi:hypothetical protein